MLRCVPCNSSSPPRAESLRADDCWPVDGVNDCRRSSSCAANIHPTLVNPPLPDLSSHAGDQQPGRGAGDGARSTCRTTAVALQGSIHLKHPAHLARVGFLLSQWPGRHATGRHAVPPGGKNRDGGSARHTDAQGSKQPERQPRPLSWDEHALIRELPGAGAAPSHRGNHARGISSPTNMRPVCRLRE